MLKSKSLAGCLALLVSAWVLGTAALSPVSSFAATEPCAPTFESGQTPDPDDGLPSPPKNLRILIGLLSAPFQATLHAASHPYFDMLAARADCHVAYSLRSQAQLDAMPTTGKKPPRLPVVYDPVMDAAQWAIDPSGATPGSGSTGTMQKRPYVSLSGGSSFLLTWDTRFDEGFLWQEGKLDQHKTWKLMTEDEAQWLGWKTNYERGASHGRLAELLMSTPNATFLTNGTSKTMYGSEILGPRVSDFYLRENKWTRYWFFVEGEIAPGSIVFLSAWAADEDRDPVLLYDRLPYLSPGLIKQFYIFYDSSMETNDITAYQGLSKSWNRNVVALTGITRAEVVKLLQRPTK